jgi:hypothetical protein
MSFDPNLFVQSQNEGALSTQYVPIPEAEYTAVIDAIKARQAKDNYILDVTWAIDSDEIRELTGMDKPTVRQSIFLDITPQGGLDIGKGKNVQLGRLREALGQNDGRPWSPNMLEGQVATIMVTQRLVDTDKDGNALPESEHKIYNDVKGVMAA